MTLTDAERGMLLSKMADDTVASIFGKSVKWVRKARDWLAEEAARPAQPARLRPSIVSGTAAETMAKPAPAGKLASADDTTYLETNAGDREAYTIGALTKPPEIYRVTVTSRFPSAIDMTRVLGEPGQTFMGRAEPLPATQVEKPALAPPVRRRDPDPRVTPALIRYVRWFHDANTWTWREISELFEIEVEVLRDALTEATPAG